MRLFHMSCILYVLQHTKPWAWGPGSGFQNLKPGQRCGPDEGFGLAWLGLVRPGLAGPRA
jgi:hypothetical protein